MPSSISAGGSLGNGLSHDAVLGVGFNGGSAAGLIGGDIGVASGGDRTGEVWGDEESEQIIPFDFGEGRLATFSSLCELFRFLALGFFPVLWPFVAADFDVCGVF